jgi:hypothetical protein
LTLPEGCFANFDLRLIDFLKSLERPGIQAEYEALRDSLGRRPTPTEAYRAGMSMVQMRRQYGSWFEMLSGLAELTADESAVVRDNGPLLREVETAHMTRSYKMVLLEAFQELNGWRNGPALPVLAARSWQVLSRRRQFLADLPESFQNPQAQHSEEWVRYWRKNPVDAWIGATRGDAGAFFALSEGRLVPKTAVVDEQIESLQELVQQLIDYRFATYEHRQAAVPAKQRDSIRSPCAQGHRTALLSEHPHRVRAFQNRDGRCRGVSFAGRWPWQAGSPAAFCCAGIGTLDGWRQKPHPRWRLLATGALVTRQCGFHHRFGDGH